MTGEPLKILTDEEIAELRKLDLVGELWLPGGAHRFITLGDDGERDAWQTEEDKRAEATACAARNALPRLLDFVERARKLLNRVTAADGWCPGCRRTMPGHESDCELAALIGKPKVCGYTAKCDLPGHDSLKR